MVTNFIDDISSLEGIGAQVIYREYASLTFFFVVEKQSESELAILDFIQLLMIQALSFQSLVLSQEYTQQDMLVKILPMSLTEISYAPV